MLDILSQGSSYMFPIKIHIYYSHSTLFCNVLLAEHWENDKMIHSIWFLYCYMFLYLMALYWSHDYSMCACCFNLQVNLRLILVSGKTKEFLFYPNDSVADVTDFVYRNWPRGNIKPFFPRCNLFKRRCAKLWKMCHVTETPPFPPLN